MLSSFTLHRNQWKIFVRLVYKCLMCEVDRGSNYCYYLIKSMYSLVTVMVSINTCNTNILSGVAHIMETWPYKEITHLLTFHVLLEVKSSVDIFHFFYTVYYAERVRSERSQNISFDQNEPEVVLYPDKFSSFTISWNPEDS